MLRGCQKKIVFLKNTGSKIFDEAYFVISDNVWDDKICDTDMITEANRIIDECIGLQDCSSRGGIISRALRSVKRFVLPFFLGALFSAVLGILFVII